MAEAPTSSMADIASDLEKIAEAFGKLNTDTTMDFAARQLFLQTLKDEQLVPLIDKIKRSMNKAPEAPIKEDKEGAATGATVVSEETAVTAATGMPGMPGGAKGKSKSSRGPSKDKRKKKGGADINFDTMGSQVMNTGDLLNNQYMANLVPRAWDGPSPFSAGSTLAETITKGIPDSLVNAMDPPIVRGGGKKKSSSSKKSSSASKPSKSKK